MSSKPSKSLIGMFVLGAVALAIGAVVALGSGMFFTHKYTFILFFENSVSGLEVGAPVLFRGVPIGSVKEISIDADAARLHFYIPVVVEILSGKVRLTKEKQPEQTEPLLLARKEDPETLLKDLIAKGLRAQLVTQSFVTGQLAVALDMMPDTPVRLVGTSPLPEIPTVPSAFEKLAQTLKKLPLEELVDRLIKTVSGIEGLVNSPQMQQMPAKVDNALNVGTDMLGDLKSRIEPLAKDLEVAIKSYNDLARHLDSRTEGLSSSAGRALESLDGTLKEGKQAMAKVQRVLSSDSPTVTELNKAIGEVGAAARAIRSLADTLERHPEALIQGKGSYRR